jgi:hypothetical protein
MFLMPFTTATERRRGHIPITKVPNNGVLGDGKALFESGTAAPLGRLFDLHFRLTLDKALSIQA